ncbi:MAG: hypothetical protein Kow00121_11360 [Elainellaceae cyanobacterium]
MPKVSVIIPAFNGDRFIAKAVESVFNQTYQDYEIIVIDDGSTDQTQQVLEPYFDRIQYVYQTNQGVATARNQGLALAQGEFVAFLDQDDVWLPQKLALQIACLNEQPNIGMVHSGWRRVNQLEEKLSDIEPWYHAPKLDLHEWLQWMPILLSAMLFRRKWVEAIGGFDTNFQQACDVELIQQLVLKGCQTAWIKQITTYYRQHDRNDSSNTLLQAKESWAVRNKFFTRADIPELIRQRENQYRYHTLVWIAWRLYITNHLQEMKKYLQISLEYTPYPLTASVINWTKTFTTLSIEQGQKFDLISLISSDEWQTLIRTTLRS